MVGRECGSENDQNDPLRTNGVSHGGALTSGFFFIYLADWKEVDTAHKVVQFDLQINGGCMDQETAENRGEIVIFTDSEGTVQTDVKLFNETLWLTQYQLESLFDTDRTSIVRHIQNILETGELEETATCAKFAQVRLEGSRNVTREITYYNLDMILSVGYRVNSKQGTQFRIWANRILKEYMTKGYLLNEKRLKEKNVEIVTLKSAITLIERSVLEKTETIEEVKELIRVLSDFSKGLTLLDDYDNEKLDTRGSTAREAVVIEPDEFYKIVYQMKSQFDSILFGTPKDDSFISSVRQIYQVFDAKELYPSIEEKAAMLLYLIVKNHSFIDGNKRIAAAIFLYFLNRNSMLYMPDQKPVINSETLASITLLVAESKPEEKDTMKRVIMTLLNRGRQ